MESKIFFIDIDDTLTRSDQTISDITKKVIKEAINNNHRIIITTGRPEYYARKIANELEINDYVIAFNGAEISNGTDILCNYYIENEIAYKVIEYAFINDIRLVVALDNMDYVTKEIRNNKQKLLDKNTYKEELKNKLIKTCMFISENKTKVMNAKEYFRDSNDLQITYEKDINDTWKEDWFVIGNKISNKGSAILKVADHYNIPYKNTVAIGNGTNDISMFEVSGISVAMSNSLDSVKEKADIITKSNDEDGVAYIINKILVEDDFN